MIDKATTQELENQIAELKKQNEILLLNFSTQSDEKAKYVAELELQNKEFRLAKEKEKLISDKYTSLYDFAPTGYITLDRKSRICELNFRSANMIGKERSKLVNSNFIFFITPENHIVYTEFLDKLFQTKTRQTCRLQLCFNDKPTFYVRLDGTVADNGQECLLTVVDVSEHMQAEAIRSIQYDIIRIALSTKKLSEFYEAVRRVLGRIINVDNFYVAFYDEKTDQLSAVFEKDNKDQIPKWPSRKSLTGMVIKEQKPLILKKAEILNLANAGEIEFFGARAEVWLGVPLIIEGKVSGALVVQDYENPKAYNQTHLELLEMVSSEMSISIERKQSEEALKHRESVLTAIFNSTEDGLLVVDNNGKPMHKNTNFSKLWRIPSKLINSINDKKGLDFAVSQLSDPNQFKDKLKELHKSSKSDLDFLNFKDGRILESRSTPLLERKTVKGRVWSFNDITERRKTEEALKESEERFRRLFDDLGDAVFVTKIGGTDSGQIIKVNQAAEKQTGYTRNELLKMKMASNLHVTGSSEISLNEWDKALLKGQKLISVEKKRKKDGTEYWTEVVITPIDFKGEKACLSINHDITKRKLAEITLKKSELKLKELNASKDKLFSIIAHDLRSPFNGILGFSELLIENVKDFDIEESESYLEIINTSAKNTLVLLDNLLNWAKSQTGQLSFMPNNIMLSTVVQEVLESNEQVATAKNISLNYTPELEFEVYADENMLSLVLRNLISNAIKYTDSGGKIDISAVSQQECIQISVADNGVGISEENKKKIFRADMDFTMKGTANEKGSGLGLILCKEFVEKHHGKIWVESYPENQKGGSVFKFTLPLKK